MFRKKAQRAEEAKMLILRAAASAPVELKPLIDLLSGDIWRKNYKMAETRCIQNADNIDKYPKIRELLCLILPDYARFVEIRQKNN